MPKDTHVWVKKTPESCVNVTEINIVKNDRCWLSMYSTRRVVQPRLLKPVIETQSFIGSLYEDSIIFKKSNEQDEYHWNEFLSLAIQNIQYLFREFSGVLIETRYFWNILEKNFNF